MRRKTALLSALCLIAFALDLDAQGILKEGFNTDDFPVVSFVWHEYNPEVLSQSDFQSFAENGIKCDAVVENLPSSIKADENRYVVFLWEDLAYHGANLYDFAKSSLLGFIESAGLKENDKINVSVYGRREVNEESYLKSLTDGFVSGKDRIMPAIEGYKRSQRYYSSYPNRADIFPAVSEAIQMLSQQGDGVKSIVLITAGYPLDNSSASSDMNARLLAEKYHIPVYVLQYGKDHGFSAKLSSFAPLTYGTFRCFKNLSQKENISDAIDALSGIYGSLATRYHGRDYKITFTSSCRRGDDASMVEFKVNGHEAKEMFMPPARSLAGFFKDYPLIAALCCLTICGLIALAVVFYVRSRRSDKKAIESIRQQSEQSSADAMGAISDTRNLLGRKIDEIREDMDYDKAADLEDLMRRKNVYPRLVCNVNGILVSHTVTKIHTSIGRDSGNDLVLSDARVSRRHAEIIFTGNSFEIADAGSTNGIFVNGQRISSTTVLKDADKLEIGGVSITVYI